MKTVSFTPNEVEKVKSYLYYRLSDLSKKIEELLYLSGEYADKEELDIASIYRKEVNNLYKEKALIYLLLEKLY